MIEAAVPHIVQSCCRTRAVNIFLKQARDVHGCTSTDMVQSGQSTSHEIQTARSKMKHLNCRPQHEYEYPFVRERRRRDVTTCPFSQPGDETSAALSLAASVEIEMQQKSGRQSTPSGSVGIRNSSQLQLGTAGHVMTPCQKLPRSISSWIQFRHCKFTS